MDLKATLEKDSVKHIDLSFYIEVEKGTMVFHVIEKMQASHRKCALVMEKGQLVGIFTAHDIARKITGKPEAYKKNIEDLMTPNPETIDAELTVVDAIETMNSKPYRYRPVVNNNGQVLGTLTHYAIIKYISDYFPEEIYNLPPEPDQIAKTRDGA